MRQATWGGDLSGGIVSTIMGLPKAIPWGILVFASLGSLGLAVGTFASLVALAFANIGSAATRGSPILNSGPFSITTIMLAAVVPVILSHTSGNVNDPAIVTFVIELIFFTVFLSGIFQALFGLVKIGTLAKYIPYPVIAGLMNGAGIAIIVSQIRPLLGIGKEIPLFDFAALAHSISFPALIVGGLTLLLFWQGDRLSRLLPLSFLKPASPLNDVNRRKSPRIPPAFFGLVGGSLIFYLANALAWRGQIGSTIGDIAGGIPTPAHLFSFFSIAFHSEHVSLLLKLAAIAISIAIVNSLRSLIVVMAIDNVVCERSDANKVLIGQGVGNMLSASFGGISSAVSQSTSIAGYRNGSSTSATKIYSGLFALVVLLILTPVISLLPKLVLTASLIMMGVEALDGWSLKLLRNLFSAQEASKAYVDVFVVSMVTGLSVFYGTNEALAIGIFLSVVNFIYRMGKDIVAKDYDATKIRSNIVRPNNEVEFLESKGDQIRVLDLQGALFFGTTDKLASDIDNILSYENRRVRYIILNFRKVSEIDGSGGNILGQIRKRCQKSDVQVLLCASGFPSMERYFKSWGLLDIRKGIEYHDSVDSALGYAEDQLLDTEFGGERYQLEKSLAELSVLSIFTDAELMILLPLLNRSHFENGHYVYHQGEVGDSLFFILRGRVRIELLPVGATTPFTISLLCSGMMFGEMSFIDGSPRSASILAQDDLVCVSISQSAVSALLISHPEMVKKLYHGLTLTLLQRLRTSDRAISKLRD